MQFYTSYYASKKLDRAKHYLVRTSLGFCRWTPCDEEFPALAPEPEWIGLSEAEYRPLYIAKLESIGADTFTEWLRLLHNEAEGKSPVLLCYEALRKPGEFCHRRMFAEWYESKTGVVIPELGHQAPAPLPDRQESLF